MESGTSRLLVLPRAVGGYELRETLTGPVLVLHPTRDGAIRRAVAMLETRRGGRIVLIAADGTNEEVTVAAARRPWWYQSSPVLRWLLPALLSLSLALRFVARSDDVVGQVATAVLVSLLLLSLSSAAASTRRDRSPGPRPADRGSAVHD